MKLSLINSTIKIIIEGMVFITVTIILFNELTQVLKTLSIFEEENIRMMGIISFLLATDNLLSQKLLGLNIFK